MRRIGSVLAVVMLLGVACGGGGDGGGSDSAASEANNEADIMFAQQMIPHHEQAVEMAEMAVESAEDPDVKKLAERIIQAQGPEIDAMKELLSEWDAPLEAGGHAGMDTGTEGMMSDEDMTELESAQGKSFDSMFLEMMIEHHQSAIEMARAELEDGESSEAKELAQDIISAQEKEISEMEEMLDS